MMKYLSTLCLTVLILAGCSRTHYYRLEKSELVLYLKKPAAQNVFFVSSLNNFRAVPAQKESGAWEVHLPAGVSFSYFYLVDGQPLTPACRLQESDDFGSRNCIFDPAIATGSGTAE